MYCTGMGPGPCLDYMRPEAIPGSRDRLITDYPRETNQLTLTLASWRRKKGRHEATVWWPETAASSGNAASNTIVITSKIVAAFLSGTKL